ncbi:MAG: hypothetical protein U0R19_18855 [Bryobacteraceae bacterium]
MERSTNSTFRNPGTTALATLLALTSCGRALGQATQPVLIVDVENVVNYNNNLTDQPKLVPNDNITPAAPVNLQGVFGFVIAIGDVVAVNGQPARGTLVLRAQVLNLVPADAPREANAPQVVAIADTMRAALQTVTLELLKSNGVPVGIFTLIGMGGRPPLGAPSSITSFNFTVVGGTGAFLGMRGQAGYSGGVGGRSASMAENPANRRINGGGRRRVVLQLIPHSLPQILATSGGPAVYHEDFSPVSTARPAKPGELLIIKASGLGPTLPQAEPGEPFPMNSPPELNSPFEVSVNGKAAEVLNKTGWPGLVDTYRVDFRVPAGIEAGTAGVQLTAAWITGPSTPLPIE